MASTTSQAKLNCTELSCSAIFTTKSNLTRHIKAVHGQKSEMACQKKLSNQPWNIKRHVGSCDECKRRAASDDGLDDKGNKNNTNDNTNATINYTVNDNNINSNIDNGNINGSNIADVDMLWSEEHLPNLYMDLSGSFPADFDFGAYISSWTPGDSLFHPVDELES